MSDSLDPLLPVATWAVCLDCLRRGGWQIGSDAVAHVYSRHVMLTVKQPAHPATLWLQFDEVDDMAYELCGCGWRPTPLVVVSWHVYKTNKFLEAQGLQVPDDDLPELE